jgi:hypothetical protein
MMIYIQYIPTLYVGVLISLWLSKGILFLQDNAACHKAAVTQQRLVDVHSEVLKHPAYTPDLTPSDCYLFPSLFIKPFHDAQNVEV